MVIMTMTIIVAIRGVLRAVTARRRVHSRDALLMCGMARIIIRGIGVG